MPYNEEIDNRIKKIVSGFSEKLCKTTAAKIK